MGSGSTLKRLKIYYVNNFRVTRHGLWLIVGIALLMMIVSRLFDYRPTAFYEVRSYRRVHTHTAATELDQTGSGSSEFHFSSAESASVTAT